MAPTETPAADPALEKISASPMVQHLREELRTRWPATAERVHDIARYALLAPGKMLRPILLAASASAVGGDYSGAIPAALAVEYLHVATLIHDDVIDNDDVRRGQPSVHARYGMADALVTGDFLVFDVFSTMAECAERGVPSWAVLDAARVLAEAGTDLCRGQAREAELTRRGSCRFADYEAMISLKTGALFRAACRAGAILGGACAERIETLARFAEHLGVAFQMHDDLLPYLADASVTGKPNTSDVSNLRLTFPVLIGHEIGTGRDRHRLAEALSGRLPADAAYGLVREVLDRTGALDQARVRAESEVAKARREITALPASDGGDLLAAVAELSINRDR